MLKDITLGQYFPGNTPIHRMDPRTKLLLTMVYIVALFPMQRDSSPTPSRWSFWSRRSPSRASD